MKSPKVRGDLEYYEQEIEGDDVVIVRDPIRGTYFKFNVLQAAMLRALDGETAPDRITQRLAEEYDAEIPPVALERFIAKAREMMLLEITSQETTHDGARRQVYKAMRKAGFHVRSARVTTDAAGRRTESEETKLFAEAFRQIDLGHPRAAASYLAKILRNNPDNARARQLYELIQTAFIKAAGGTTDYPTWVILNPGKMLTWMSKKFGRFLFGWMGIIAIAIFIAIGSYAYGFITDDPAPLGPFDIIVTIAFILLMNLFHELGHGFACQHYGGNVTEIGFILFYNFKPAAFCDTSSSYLISDRKAKVIIQLAGTIASLIFLSANAILLALLSPEVSIYPGLSTGLIIASAFAFLSLWPLLKLDGYYAVSDYLGFPNMRDRAFKLLKASLAKRLFGLEIETEDLPPRTRKWLLVYAVLARTFTACFVLFLFTRIIAGPLIEHFRGWGLLFAITLGIYAWRRIALKPIWKGLKTLVRERRTIFTVRRSAVFVVVLAALIGPLFVRWPLLVDSSFEIIPIARADVRAQVGGRVATIHTHEGARVHRGDPLATLDDPSLVAHIAMLEAEREIADHQLAQVTNGARPEELALAKRHLDSARSQLASNRAAATTVARLAKATLGTEANADRARQQTAAVTGQVGAASWSLSLLQAGERPEAIASAQAECNRIDVEIADLRAQRELLVLRSPIDGVVTTPHLDDKLQLVLAPGDVFAEVHDQSHVVAELPLSPITPMSEIAVGDEVMIRPESDPRVAVSTRIAMLRTTKSADGEPSVVAVTAPFELDRPTTGLSGHARIYGANHSIAYAILYEPLQRLVRVRLWSMY